MGLDEDKRPRLETKGGTLRNSQDRAKRAVARLVRRPRDAGLTLRRLSPISAARSP